MPKPTEAGYYWYRAGHTLWEPVLVVRTRFYRFANLGVLPHNVAATDDADWGPRIKPPAQKEAGQ